jgi:hypothetical protein
MRDKQNCDTPNESDGLPTAFSSFDTILFSKGVWIGENQFGHLKPDAMLAPVALGFRFVPLKYNYTSLL